MLYNKHKPHRGSLKSIFKVRILGKKKFSFILNGENSKHWLTISDSTNLAFAVTTTYQDIQYTYKISSTIIAIRK